MADEHNCTSSANSFVALVVSFGMNYVMHWRFENEQDSSKAQTNVKVFSTVFLTWFLYNTVSRLTHKIIKPDALHHFVDVVINATLVCMPWVIFNQLSKEAKLFKQEDKYDMERRLCLLLPLAVFGMIEINGLSTTYCNFISFLERITT